MRISLNFLVRIAGMLILAYLGARIGQGLSGRTPSDSEVLATQLLMLSGAGLGLLTTHRWTIEPLQELMRRLHSMPVSTLISALFGVLLGLVLGVLVAVPLGYLPAPFGQYLPLLAAGLLAWGGAVTLLARQRDVGELLARRPAPVLPVVPGQSPEPRRYLVDTSAIIDGRIRGVVQSGFLDGVLIVPRFVLNELQRLADSADELRRARGRRGLELLQQMQKELAGTVEVTDVEVEGAQGVDDRLVIVARQYRCPIISTDYNLNKVAGIQGVRVLSLNQLSDAMRPPVTPGQHLRVMINNPGREREQGIAFLEDGTMVVVEEARRFVGEEVGAVVTRIYQTQTGRIVFAQLEG